MKRLLGAVLSILLILIGGSLVMFVLRMIWLPPGPMGMMMGKAAMYHHMGSWFRGTFIFSIVFVIIILITIIILNNKDGKDK